MVTIEDAKMHLIKMIMSTSKVDEHLKIRSLVQSLETIYHCSTIERHHGHFYGNAFKLEEFPPLLDDEQ